MKFIFLYFLICSAVCAEKIVNENNCKKCGIEILYEKRVYIADLFSSCTLYNRSCTGVQQIINKFQNASHSEWQKNKEEFWRFFFNLSHVNSRANVPKIEGVLPNDTILTELYAKSLAFENSQNVQQEAFRILTEYTPYTLLDRYSRLIKDALCASDLPTKQKNLLYSYCTPEQPLRDELLADSTLPVSARIRLGNKKAEDELIGKFNTTSDFHEKEDIVAQLANAGSEKCLHFLIKTFNKPIYEYGIDSCILQSVGLSIIKGFQRHLPNDPNFNKRYNGIITCQYSSRDKNDNTRFVQYVKDVMGSFKKQYGVMPDDTTFIPILMGPLGCNRPY